jgi:diguanylate cyclase (GGDEF)-like protein
MESLLKLQDPSLTTAQMFWAISATMVTVYLANDRRTILLMMTLLAIMFGGLQYSKSRVFLMTLYSLALYGIIIYLLIDIPSANLNIRQEMVVYFVYAMILIGYNVLALEMIVTRQYLKDKSLYLQSNLHKVEIESITDSLTGIGNRRFLQKMLKGQLSMAERSHQYFFSLSMVDIDFFKQINDQYGHDMGDKVLQKMSYIINRALRQSDTFGRYGGEEFIIISPLTDAQSSIEFAERVRKLVEDETFDRSTNLKVTISIGVTVYQDSETVERTLKRVDEALYLAKKRGRNRVVAL